MDSAHLPTTENFITLKKAAEILSVPVNTLLDWNDSNILKPTISQEGKVGYTKTQLQKFIEIQQLSKFTKLTSEKSSANQHGEYPPKNTSTDSKAYYENPKNIISDPSPTNKFPPMQGSGVIDNIKTPINNYQTQNHIFDKPEQNVSPQSAIIGQNNKKVGNVKLRHLGLISSFSVVFIFIIALAVTQQNRFLKTNNKSLLTSKEDVGNDNTFASPQIKNVNFSDYENPNTQQSTKISGNSIIPPQDLLSSPFAMFTQYATDKTKNDPLQILGYKGTNIDLQNINAITNFASRPNTISDSQSVFDENGNIKGKTTSPEKLATNLGSPLTMQNNSSTHQSLNLYIILSIISTGLFLTIYSLNKRPAYSSVESSSINMTGTTSATTPSVQKILEVDQKADGTVVLYFQNNEFKVSKPELNSETDRFIERLVGLTGGNVKRLRYDLFKDEKIKLDTPLSKLVTRLGFVGMKRDLIFPRTSKNKVIFRRYITKEDLSSMGLTEKQISSELVN